jgi:predicted RNase H-like nuclease (RuvC/YqgF family)
MPDGTPPRVVKNGDGSFSVNVHSQPVGEMPEVPANPRIYGTPETELRRRLDVLRLAKGGRVVLTRPDGSTVTAALAALDEFRPTGTFESGLVRVLPEVVQVPYEQHKQMEQRITRQRWQLRALNRSIVGLKHYAGDMQGTLDRVRKNRDQWRNQALETEQEVARQAKEIEGLSRQLAMLNRLLTVRTNELNEAEQQRAAERLAETPPKRRWWQ